MNGNGLVTINFNQNLLVPDLSLINRQTKRVYSEESDHFEYARRILQDNESATNDTPINLHEIINLEIKNMDAPQSYDVYLETWDPLYMELNVTF